MGLLSFVRAQWDRTGAVVAAVVGLVALGLGWFGTSGTQVVADQVPYIISGGLTGVVLIGIAATLWLSADLRDEWREVHTLSMQLADED